MTLFDNLRESEGFRARPYLCPAGKASIGYGCNLESAPGYIRPWSPSIYARVMAGQLKGQPLVDALSEIGMEWPREGAEQAMRLEVAHLRIELAERIPNFWIFLNAARQDVLLEMAYNMGIGSTVTGKGLMGFSKLFAAVGREDYEEAARQIVDSKPGRDDPGNADDGLVTRYARLAEQMRTGEEQYARP